MNAKFSFLSLLLIVLFSAQISLANEPAAMLARKAVSADPAEAAAGISELRALGQEGMQALLTEHSEQIYAHIRDPRMASTPEWERLTTAMDKVGQQKNNFISGLYWYTDFEEAKRAARESGKPILSLRLLGNLTDELSCANSRFFRTVLYPNGQLRELLRDHYVLHWKSVRPAPRITIDFGDGRKIESTITGNSIHYILDSDGQLLEAIPGLYGPSPFKRNLEAAETLFKSLPGKTGRERNALLYSYYTDRSKQTSLAWQGDTKQFGDRIPPRLRNPQSQDIDAVSVGPVAITKMAVERPAARAVISASDALGRLTDEQAWKLIASQHPENSILDELSMALMKLQNRSLSDQDLSRLIIRFQESIGLDTVRNEYMLRPAIYDLLSKDAWRMNLENFNEHVYAKLFLTPRSDQWLGLVSPDIYTATDNGGVVKGQ